MNQHKWHLAILAFLGGTLLLNACTFTVEVLGTPTATQQAVKVPPPTIPATPTFTPFVPTEVIASATPTLISIRSDTISMLEIFRTFETGDIVRGMAFSPDGSILAAAGGNTENFGIGLWDVPSGQSLRTLGGHRDIIWDLAFSPDGQALVSVSSDRTAKVHDWRMGEILHTINLGGQAVRVRFASNGQTLAVGGVDTTQVQPYSASVATFAAGSWNPLLKFPEYINITAMAYSPDGRWLVGGGTSRNVQVWRTGDGTPVYTLNHSHQAFDAEISPDSTTVATATCQVTEDQECNEGAVWLWNLTNGRLIDRLRDFPGFVENVAFTADGSALVAVSRSGMLRIYSTEDYRVLFEATPPGGFSALALSPDGGLLATGNSSGQVHVWKIIYRP